MRRRRRKNRIIFTLCIILLITIAGGFIYIGLYFDDLAKPKTVLGVGIDKVSYYLKTLLADDGKYKIGDNFAIEGTIDFELDSEYYLNESVNNIEYKQKYNLIKNISNMDTKFNIKQDKSSKKLYMDLEEKIGEESIISSKYFSENSTEYYMVKSVLPNYVNNGSFNYFETLDEENTTKDNIEYLYDYIFIALKNNLKDEYFTKYQVNQNIAGKNIKVNQYSIKLTDSVIRKILNGILDDLKKDERASKILKNTFKDFEELRIEDDKFFLESKESYTLNVYSTRYLHKPLKYELIHLKGDDKTIYTYEGDFTKGEIYVVEQDKVIYEIDSSMKKNNIEFIINDANLNKLGEIKIERDSTGSNYIFNFDDENMKYDFVYSSKFSNVKKNTSYTNEKKLSFKVVKNKVSQLNGDIVLTTNVSKDVAIVEDASDAVLSSTLTEEQNKKLDNLKESIKERLEK